MDKFMAYVIVWRYSDGSASGAVSVHPSMAAAAKMMDLLELHGDGMKSFTVQAVPCEIRAPGSAA